MKNYSDIPGSLRIPHQAELDAKKRIINQNALKDLGLQNNLAYTYGESLQIYCQEERTLWEWRQPKIGEVGLLTTDFIYPNGWIADNINYSLLKFNFFQIKDKLEIGNFQGNAETLDTRISELEATYNKIVTTTGFTLVGQNLTINPLWKWIIMKKYYSNPSIVVKNIPFCSVGKKRIDYIVPNNNNSFDRIEGLESTNILLAPNIPNENLYVTFFVVTDTEIEEPSVPIIGDNYISKQSKSFIRMFFTGNVDSVTIDDKSWLKFEQGMTSLKSINILDPKNFYFGKSYIIKNGSTNNVILHHQDGTGTFKFNFPNKQNLVLKPEESVHFIMRAINYTNTGGLLDFVGSQETQLSYPYNEFKLLQKGFGNNDLQNEEVGDIFSGWSDDGTIRYTEAIWLGGPKNTSTSFNPLVFTSLI